MIDTLYYLDDFTDETMPCLPTLEAWAEWLAKPDPIWGRAEAAQDGQRFAASTMTVLCDCRADYVDGRWKWAEQPPSETDHFFLRHYEGSTGWDAGFSGDDLENAADGLADCSGDDPVWFACVKYGEDIRVRFEAEGPICVIEALETRQ